MQSPIIMKNLAALPTSVDLVSSYSSGRYFDSSCNYCSVNQHRYELCNPLSWGKGWDTGIWDKEAGIRIQCISARCHVNF